MKQDNDVQISSPGGKIPGLSTLATLGSILFSTPEAPPSPIAQSQQNSNKDGWYPGVCKMCMQGACVTRVRVENGIVVKVEGDERAKNNEGRLCPRGNASIPNMYNPWRIKAPMKRTNPEKGLDVDPGWVEISWEEALNTVAAEFKRLKDDDPRKIVFNTGMGTGAWGEDVGVHPMAKALGTPNVVTSRGQHCSYHFWGEYTMHSMPDVHTDMDLCEYMINVGKTQGPNVCTADFGSKEVVEAIDRGCTLITVDPRCSQEASLGEWVPIKPGTDQAFMLGILWTMIYEIEKYDEYFVRARTNAAYLIGTDGDYLRDKTSNKPLLWDAVLNKAIVFDEIEVMNCAIEGQYEVDGTIVSPAFQLIKDSVKDYTPEWAEEISTVPATTIRRIANDLVSHAKIGSTIELDGVILPFRPVSINVQSGGYQHTFCGPRADMVSKIILELLGALDVPGGANMMVMGGFVQPREVDADGVLAPIHEVKGEPWNDKPDRIDVSSFYPVAHSRTSIMPRAMLDPEKYRVPYRVEMIFNNGGNPVRAYPNIDTFVEAFKQVKFVTGIYYTFDEGAMLSDIVLPDSSFLERDYFEPGMQPPHKVTSIRCRGLLTFHRRDCSAIKTLYNTRNNVEIMFDLAERSGVMYGKGGFIDHLQEKGGPVKPSEVKLDYDKPLTYKEYANTYLRDCFNVDYTIDEITDETGPTYIYVTPPKVVKENYCYSIEPGSSTRHPMYMVELQRLAKRFREGLASSGMDGIPGWPDMEPFWAAYDPLPTWLPSPHSTAPEGFDLWLLNYKTQGFPFGVGDTLGNPWLHEVIGGYDPYEFNVLLNSQTAAKKGLKTGDTIVIESLYGKTTGRLKTTQLIHPQTLAVPGIHGLGTALTSPLLKRGTSVNRISPFREEDMAVDPITGGLERSPALKIYKATEEVGQ
jgi:anaerobic selenocysteine-containing dehydrogenase